MHHSFVVSAGRGGGNRTLAAWVKATCSSLRATPRQRHLVGTTQRLVALAMSTGLLDHGRRDEGISRGRRFSLHGDLLRLLIWWKWSVRTDDLLLAKQLLSQLSYTPINWCQEKESNLRRAALQATALPTELSRHRLERMTGLEPAASTLARSRSTN